MIKGIFRDVNRNQTKKNLNVTKVLEYLRQFEKFNSRHLFNTNKIVKGLPEVIFELIIDIHDYYCKGYIPNKTKEHKRINQINNNEKNLNILNQFQTVDARNLNFGIDDLNRENQKRSKQNFQSYSSNRQNPEKVCLKTDKKNDYYSIISFDLINGHEEKQFKSGKM